MPEIEELVDDSSENVVSSSSSSSTSISTSSSGEGYMGPCAVCNKIENTKQCAKCKCVAYCSRACQVAHWKAGHKQACPTLGAARAAAASKAADEAKLAQQTTMEAALTDPGTSARALAINSAVSAIWSNEEEELVSSGLSEMGICAACACTCAGCAVPNEEDQYPTLSDDIDRTDLAIQSAIPEVPLALPGTAAAAASSPGAATPQNVAADDAAAAANALGGIAAAVRAEGTSESPLAVMTTALSAALAVTAPPEEGDKCGVCMLPKQFEQHTLACGHSYCAACVEALERHSIEYLCPWDACRTPAALKQAASQNTGGGKESSGSGGGPTNNNSIQRVPVYGAPCKAKGWSNRSYSSSSGDSNDDEDVEYVPSEPEAQNEAAARMYVPILRQVERGLLTWKTIPAPMQHSMGRAADLLRQAADSGYPPAQCSLGLIFLEDTGAFAGVACDPSRAVEWFRKAAKQGLAEAQCQLGHMYAAGSGVERDAELAMEWYGKAAAQRHVSAMCLVGKGLLLGYIETVAQTGDPPYGFVNLKPPPSSSLSSSSSSSSSKGRSSTSTTSGSKNASDSGGASTNSPGAGFMKGNVSVPESNAGGSSSSSSPPSFAEQSAALGAREPRESGVPGFPVLAVPKDRSKGLALLTEAESYAQSGEAAFLLGLACRRPAKAFEWYALAAQRGHPPGQAAAGRALYLGDGVESNQEEAVEYLRLAATAGDAEAQFILGTAYQTGDGVARNAEEAIEWFTLAAKQGSDAAQYSLGIGYWHGRFFPDATEDERVQHYRRAAGWWVQAAKQGNADAQQGLGLAFWIGQGTTKDPTKAVSWFRLAAQQGQPNAQHNLGFAYWVGEGTEEQDQVKAVELYTLAAVQGLPDAMYCLGVAYSSGKGVPAIDTKEAKVWWTKAHEAGNPKAAKALSDLEESEAKATRDAAKKAKKKQAQKDAKAREKRVNALQARKEEAEEAGRAAEAEAESSRAAMAVARAAALSPFLTEAMKRVLSRPPSTTDLSEDSWAQHRVEVSDHWRQVLANAVEAHQKQLSQKKVPDSGSNDSMSEENAFAVKVEPGSAQQELDALKKLPAERRSGSVLTDAQSVTVDASRKVDAFIEAANAARAAYDDLKANIPTTTPGTTSVTSQDGETARSHAKNVMEDEETFTELVTRANFLRKQAFDAKETIDAMISMWGDEEENQLKAAADAAADLERKNQKKTGTSTDASISKGEIAQMQVDDTLPVDDSDEEIVLVQSSNQSPSRTQSHIGSNDSSNLDSNMTALGSGGDGAATSATKNPAVTASSFPKEGNSFAAFFTTGHQSSSNHSSSSKEHSQSEALRPSGSSEMLPRLLATAAATAAAERSCPACTFLNANAQALVCEMCGSELEPSRDEKKEVAKASSKSSSSSLQAPSPSPKQPLPATKASKAKKSSAKKKAASPPPPTQSKSVAAAPRPPGSAGSSDKIKLSGVNGPSASAPKYHPPNTAPKTALWTTQPPPPGPPPVGPPPVGPPPVGPPPRGPPPPFVPRHILQRPPNSMVYSPAPPQPAGGSPTRLPQPPAPSQPPPQGLERTSSFEQFFASQNGNASNSSNSRNNLNQCLEPNEEDSELPSFFVSGGALPDGVDSLFGSLGGGFDTSGDGGNANSNHVGLGQRSLSDNSLGKGYNNHSTEQERLEYGSSYGNRPANNGLNHGDGAGMRNLVNESRQGTGQNFNNYTFGGSGGSYNSTSGGVGGGAGDNFSFLSALKAQEEAAADALFSDSFSPLSLAPPSDRTSTSNITSTSTSLSTPSQVPPAGSSVSRAEAEAAALSMLEDFWERCPDFCGGGDQEDDDDNDEVEGKESAGNSPDGGSNDNGAFDAVEETAAWAKWLHRDCTYSQDVLMNPWGKKSNASDPRGVTAVRANGAASVARAFRQHGWGTSTRVVEAYLGAEFKVVAVDVPASEPQAVPTSSSSTSSSSSSSSSLPRATVVVRRGGGRERFGRRAANTPVAWGLEWTFELEVGSALGNPATACIRRYSHSKTPIEA